MKIHLFNIANFKVDGGAMFGVIPKALWSRVYPADEMNLITLSLRSLIIEIGAHTILVDTGWGEKQDKKFFRHSYIHGGEGLLEGLAVRGYKPEDITDVFLTHLHADHCGGGISRSDDGHKLTFPKAVYHVSRIQWDWAVKNNIREEDAYPPENFLPLKDSVQLNLIEKEGELFPGFRIRLCYGHTPGLMIPVINNNGKTLVYTGDLIPTSAHIPLIWNMSYDLDQLATIREKESLLRESLDNNYILFFEHDLDIECCTLKETSGGILAERTFALHEI